MFTFALQNISEIFFKHEYKKFQLGTILSVTTSLGLCIYLRHNFRFLEEFGITRDYFNKGHSGDDPYKDPALTLLLIAHFFPWQKG